MSDEICLEWNTTSWLPGSASFLMDVIAMCLTFVKDHIERLCWTVNSLQPAVKVAVSDLFVEPVDVARVVIN